MSELKIITNHHARDIIYWYELSDKEKLEFDWIEGSNHDPEEFNFFRYKGNVYCTDDFMRCEGHFPGNWDGYCNDTYFSGILIKYPVEEWGELDTEHIIIGFFYS
jgi:hypothetical protein